MSGAGAGRILALSSVAALLAGLAVMTGVVYVSFGVGSLVVPAVLLASAFASAFGVFRHRPWGRWSAGLLSAVCAAVGTIALSAYCFSARAEASALIVAAAGVPQVVVGAVLVRSRAVTDYFAPTTTASAS